MAQQLTVDQIIELLRGRTGLETTPIAATDELEELGIDSIDLAYLLSHFERVHNADFTDDDYDLTRYDTVADIAMAVDARIDA